MKEKIFKKYKVVDTPEGIEVFHIDTNTTEGVWNTHNIDYFNSDDEIDQELNEIMEWENRSR